MDKKFHKNIYTEICGFDCTFFFLVREDYESRVVFTLRLPELLGGNLSIYHKMFPRNFLTARRVEILLQTSDRHRRNAIFGIVRSQTLVSIIASINFSCAILRRRGNIAAREHVCAAARQIAQVEFFSRK